MPPPPLRTALPLLLVAAALLKICESWLFESSWRNGEDFFYQHHGYEEYGEDLASGEPFVQTPRCDGCRAIARRFDAAFDLAEAAILKPTAGAGVAEELPDETVAAVVAQICRTETFEEAMSFEWRGRTRLAIKGLETWERYLTKKSWPAKPEDGRSVNDDHDFEDKEEVSSSVSVDWPQRLRNHCRFYADQLSGGSELYDLWLRISAGSQTDRFESFLCFGDAIYGDCARRINDDMESWPAGDGREDEELEDNLEDEAHEKEEDLVFFLADLESALEEEAIAANSASSF